MVAELCKLLASLNVPFFLAFLGVVVFQVGTLGTANWFAEQRIKLYILVA